MFTVDAKVIAQVRVASEAGRRRKSMAARASDGLLLCLSLLLAMPALAATPADRDECAASADKPDVGATASSTGRITTARLPTTARPSGSVRRTPGPLRIGVRLTRAKRIRRRPLR